jgi:hypothetical protein
MGSLMMSMLALLLLCQLGLAVHTQQLDGELLDWLHANGGWVSDNPGHQRVKARAALLRSAFILSVYCLFDQAHLSIENVNDDGLRGVIATVDAKEGENIALLPHDLVLEVGSERHTSVVSLPACMHVIVCPAGPPGCHYPFQSHCPLPHLWNTRAALPGSN